MKKNTTFLIALFLICASFSLSAQTITISDTPPGVDGCYSQVGAMPPITMLSLSGTTTVGGVTRNTYFGTLAILTTVRAIYIINRWEIQYNDGSGWIVDYYSTVQSAPNPPSQPYGNWFNNTGGACGNLVQFNGTGTQSALTLPIELTRFEGNPKGGYNHLTWQTATESQNKGFDIERSADGIRFEKIGFVAGKGTTNQVQNYHFEDNANVSSPLERSGEVLYYRLKQVDYDGSFEYSHVLTVKNKSKEDRFVVAPNPVGDILNIEYLGRNNDIRSIEIYDVFGKLVLQVSNDLQENEINTSNLQSGTYIWKINQNGNIQTGKFLKI